MSNIGLTATARLCAAKSRFWQSEPHYGRRGKHSIAGSATQETPGRVSLDAPRVWLALPKPRFCCTSPTEFTTRGGAQAARRKRSAASPSADEPSSATERSSDLLKASRGGRNSVRSRSRRGGGDRCRRARTLPVSRADDGGPLRASSGEVVFAGVRTAIIGAWRTRPRPLVQAAANRIGIRAARLESVEDRAVGSGACTALTTRGGLEEVCPPYWKSPPAARRTGAASPCRRRSSSDPLASKRSATSSATMTVALSSDANCSK